MSLTLINLWNLNWTAFESIILMAIYKALCKGKIIYFFHSFSFQNPFFVVISISLFIFLSPLPPAKRNILLFLSHIPKSVAIKFNNPCDVWAIRSLMLNAHSDVQPRVFIAQTDGVGGVGHNNLPRCHLCGKRSCCKLRFIAEANEAH